MMDLKQQQQQSMANDPASQVKAVEDQRRHAVSPEMRERLRARGQELLAKSKRARGILHPSEVSATHGLSASEKVELGMITEMLGVSVPDAA